MVISLATKSGSDLGHAAPKKPITYPANNLAGQSTSFEKRFTECKFAKKMVKLIAKPIK